MKTKEEIEVIEKTLPLIREAFANNNLHLDLVYDCMADCVYVVYGKERFTIFCAGTSCITIMNDVVTKIHDWYVWGKEI